MLAIIGETFHYIKTNIKSTFNWFLKTVVQRNKQTEQVYKVKKMQNTKEVFVLLFRFH